MKTLENFAQLIGRTPLVRLTRTEEAEGCCCRLYAKLESANPGGSVKDRVAYHMLEKAMERGDLVAGGTVVEPTSGNTGIGLAMTCAVLGLRAVIVMPDSMSPERIVLMEAYGAEVRLTPGAAGMAGAIEKARAIARETGAFSPKQFENPDNPEAHFLSTGPEIVEALEGRVDAFVAGVGTGGTITGCGRAIRNANPAARIVGAEPDESPVLSGGCAGPHKIQGIGAGFVPKVLDRGLLDEIVRVPGDEAIRAMVALARREGLLNGISSGAALCAALSVGRREEMRDKNLVVLLPDSGERYLSGGYFGK